MNEVERIDEPCVIYRSDMDLFMEWSGDVIIFKDSRQASEFSEKFWMFFQIPRDTESPFMICRATEEIQQSAEDADGAVWYYEIESEMEDELVYQENQMAANMREAAGLKEG